MPMTSAARQATYKQRMALYCRTGRKLELRDMDLSLEDAKILIQKTENGQDVTALLLEMGAKEKGEAPRKSKRKEPVAFTAAEVQLFRDMASFLVPEFKEHVAETLTSLQFKIESNCDEEIEAPF